MTAAKDEFDRHIRDCDEAIVIYDHLSGGAYSADFSLRFVWIAAVSALDLYVTDLILELASERFDGGLPQEPKLLSEACQFSKALGFLNLNPIQALTEFRSALADRIRYRSFHYSKDVADGLSFIWGEKGKWDRISEYFEGDAKSVREKLDSIVARRNLIAHSMDFEPVLGQRMKVKREDALALVQFARELVGAIDSLVRAEGGF